MAYQCKSDAEYNVLHKTWVHLRECQTQALALSTALSATDVYSGYAMDSLLAEIAEEIREHEESMAEYDNPAPGPFASDWARHAWRMG